MPTEPVETAPFTARERGMAHEGTEPRSWQEAARDDHTVTIGRPRGEVYAFLRDFTNLPRFMEHVARIAVADARRSHWVVEASDDRTVEWDAVIIEDEPGRRLAWRSVEGSAIHSSGRFEFHDASTGQGTEVTANITYDPPGKDLGELIAKLFHHESKVQTRRDLLRLKQFMETGEITLADAEDDEVKEKLIFI